MYNRLIFIFLLLSFQSIAQTEISDTDGDTRVQTEVLPNENKVRIKTAGLERFNIGANAAGFTRFDVFNDNQCLFMGLGAGTNATVSGSNNVGLGFRAGEKITSGFDNTFIGQSAGSFTNTGNSNVALGSSALLSNTTGFSNIAIGVASLNQMTAGTNNTAVGTNTLSQNQASDNTAIGSSALLLNTSGSGNTAVGRSASRANTTGANNTAMGMEALRDNVIGANNTVVGYFALPSNTASDNTAVGANALLFNTSGASNTAVGRSAGRLNTTGFSLTAVGFEALRDNSTGQNNTALGFQALAGNTTAGFNVAVGASALKSNTTGANLTASGASALFSNTTGSNNTAFGRSALTTNTTGASNTAIGANAGDAASGNNNCTFLGFDADNTLPGALTNATAVGNGARLTASNQVRIGNSSVTSIGGFANWTNVSDGRIKKNIRENVPGLDFILQLHPVTYTLDVRGINRRLNLENNDQAAIDAHERELQTGFIAQDVERAAQNIGYAFSGVDAPKNENDLYGLRYAEFVAPMVKAIQEQQVQIEAQKAEIEALKTLVQQLIAGRDIQPAPVLRVWPNPAEESWNISLAGAADGSSLLLIGADGKVLRTLEARDGVQSIDNKDLPSGAYYLQLQAPGQAPVTNTAVKK